MFHPDWPSSPRLPLGPGLGVTLQPGQARTLRVRGAGQLQVTQGALWLTRRGTRASEPPEDAVVAAGQSLALRAGEAVVLEPIHPGGAPAAPIAPAAFHWQPASGACAGALRWLRVHLGRRLASHAHHAAA